MTDTISFKQLAGQYKTELLDSVIPFWLEKSPDRQFGGYFSCLTREGTVFDTDKFLWLQGRQVWMFAKLYNQVEQREDWLECAIHGAEFLKRFGHDGDYNWYFSLNRAGKPLVQPYNIFSYTFAAMAFAQLAILIGGASFPGRLARSAVESRAAPWAVAVLMAARLFDAPAKTRAGAGFLLLSDLKVENS